MFIFIWKMLGLFLFIVNIYHSDAVDAVLGSNATLTCPFLPGTWSKRISGSWKQLTNDQKYSNVNTAQLTLLNVQVDDSGDYLCNSQTAYQVFNLNVIVNEGWSDWGNWISCSVTCGDGTRTRYRTCTNPIPANGGTSCQGPSNESGTCNTGGCAVNGGWGQWNGWSTCSVSCGYGTLPRSRLCNNPVPENGGYDCYGPNTDYISCNNGNCPVNGGWGPWSGWTTCSTSCGYGTSTQSRSCNNPAPAYGGKNCSGLSVDTVSCYNGICPDKPSIYVSKPSYNAAIGQNIELNCIVNSFPDLLDLWWTNRNGTRLNADRYKGGTISNPSLTITGLISSDSGYYYCNAQNSLGTSIASIQLYIGNIPSADIASDYYVTMSGNVSVTIVCKVKNGENLLWYKDNIILQKNSKYNPGNVNNSKLVIADITTDDRGVYKCYVENIYGSQSDETWLKVVQTEIPTLTYENIANKSVTLKCVIYDAMEVKWQHNNMRITTYTTRYSGGNITEPSLTITKLIRTDSGIYKCESSYDSVTSISNEIILRIRDTPLVQSSTQYVPTNVGQDAIIPCSFDSYPEPTNVFWKKDDMTLNSIDGVKYNGSSVKTPSLTIYNINNSDSGMYVCYVKNELGISFGKPVQLDVQVPLGSSSVIGIVAGSVSGGIVILALVIVVLFICYRRRKLPKKTEDRKKNKIVYNDKSSVTYRQASRKEGMYINIGRPSLISSSETDEDSPVRTSLQQKDGITENTYYNVDDIITIVQVENLKAYIAKKKTNDGLKEDYKKIPYGMQHPTTKAEQKDNMPKNRFKTTFPYDHTRVILEIVHGTAHSDYINANYVDGFEKDRCYIASQGPIKQTLQDHWRMIWQNNTRKIVMLTNLIEGSKAKCDRYWPIGGKQMTFGNMVLTLASEKERAAYITREISVEDKKTKEKRSIIQYHFTAWPDHGTPDPLYLVLFHKHFRADHNQIAGGPILVHCSAGIGRTGTFIALDALSEEGRTTGYVDIVKFVKKMRYCRMNMIQTADQYVCLHHALLEAFTMEDTSIVKEQFGHFWREIQSDKRPINQQRLNEEFKKLNAKKSEHENIQYADATSTENIDKNRSKHVLAMDNTRLYLVTFEKGRSNYINAVQVPSYTKFVGYLTTQLPLPDTKVDFWTMTKDHSSSTIVLILNDPQEADMVYSASDDSFTCGPFSVKITRQERTENNITEASLIMTKKDEKPREIALFQTICKDKPNPQDLCRLYNLISTRISMSSEPVTVVSCDGAKNCGLFCTFINAVSSMQIDAKADIFQLARLLQLRRPEFFSDFEEYRLCYEALNFYLESTNVYDNLTV